MRHFCGGEVAPEVLLRLLRAAHHAPSVGFMQPWRFIRVRDAQLRQEIHAVIEQERLQTARALGERERSEEHTSELQSPCNLVCRLLLEKKKCVRQAYDG